MVQLGSKTRLNTPPCYAQSNKQITKIGRWLHDFLTNRIQYVVVNGESSKNVTVLSGVPQGTVIGPILFLIMISDIDEGVKNHLSLYADDSRLYGQVRNVNPIHRQALGCAEWVREEQILCWTI